MKSYRYKKIHHDVNFNAKKIRIIPYFLLVFSSRIITQLSPVGKLREVREKLRDKCPTSYSKKLLSNKSVTHPRRTEVILEMYARTYQILFFKSQYLL